MAERFLKTVAIHAEPNPAFTPQEQEALAKCRAVLETIHSGSYKILSRRMNDGYENPKGYEQSYSRSNEDWLNIINVLKDGERASDDPDAAITKSSMYVNGKRFASTGREWVEIPGGEDTLLPWLAEFVWDENRISYIATPPKECGEMVMLRVDEKYVEADDADHYFVFFNFDEEGKFQTAEVQVNLLLDADFTLTESILSLDQETVDAEIQKEYRHAVE